MLEVKHKVSGYDIVWTAKSDKIITLVYASELQRDNGYHPSGYGFGSFRCVKAGENEYHATWKCASSCD